MPWERGAGLEGTEKCGRLRRAAGCVRYSPHSPGPGLPDVPSSSEGFLEALSAPTSKHLFAGCAFSAIS